MEIGGGGGGCGVERRVEERGIKLYFGLNIMVNGNGDIWVRLQKEKIWRRNQEFVLPILR